MMKGMLSCSTLLQVLRKSFNKVKVTDKRTPQIDLRDCLMSGYVLFSLKYPSLLQLDQHSRDNIILENIKHVYGVAQVPSDTQIRERLDEVDPRLLRGVFKRLFAQCQRSKRLELFKYYGERYLMPLDGTGVFYSKEIHCDQCCEKHHRDDSVSYYHQMLSGAIVHPEQKIVLPFAPEPIIKSDGLVKNDCERNAAMRFLDDLKREHPHLKLIVTGDGLFSNGPFIKRLLADNHQYILVAKEKDHKALFEEFRALPCREYEMKREKITHRFSWQNGLAINDSHLDCLVNVLEYWEENSKGKKQHWVWVTDIPLTQENVYQIMRGGRARHKIENETFNTLKNQGYQFEHNFGHGNKHLTTVFSYLMFIAFFVDQLQQLGCDAFKKAWKRLISKKSLWERKRSIVFNFIVHSLEDLWNALAHDYRREILTPDTS